MGNSRGLIVFLFLILVFPTSLALASSPSTEDFFLATEFEQLLEQNSLLTIAILPINNFSIDQNVSFHFRQRLAQNLRAKGFSVLPVEVVDRVLYDMGLSHAGQLSLLTIEELSEKINADLFLSGAVEQASKKHGGIYNAYVYTCSLRLQDSSGKNLWYVLQERLAKRRFAIDPINAIADIFLVEIGGDKVAAVQALADKMLKKFPDGPVEIVLGDSLLGEAVEIQASTE